MKILRVVLIMSVFACTNGDIVPRDRHGAVLFHGSGMIIFDPAAGSIHDEYGNVIVPDKDFERLVSSVKMDFCGRQPAYRINITP